MAGNINGDMKMAKREIKAVEASADVAAIIDRGADVDSQIKNLGFEDKGLKTKITEAAQNQLNPGELSVRLVGKTSAAVVSGVEKIELDYNSEHWKTAREALDKGLLQGVIEITRTLVMPPDSVLKAAEILQKAGMGVGVEEFIKIVDSSVLTDEGKSFVGSVQAGEAIVALSKCVKKDVTFRVKYDKN